MVVWWQPVLLENTCRYSNYVITGRGNIGANFLTACKGNLQIEIIDILDCTSTTHTKHGYSSPTSQTTEIIPWSTRAWKGGSSAFSECRCAICFWRRRKTSCTFRQSTRKHFSKCFRSTCEQAEHKGEPQCLVNPTTHLDHSCLYEQDDEPVPFAFHIALPSDASTGGAPTRITISKSIEEDVLSHPSNAFTQEDVFVIHCSPQAVFRVRPATRCSTTLSGHTSPILCASFSPTGNLLATGSGDCNARLWDLFTETPSHVLSGHKGWVLCVEWEALERKLATGGHDGHVSICSLIKQNN